MIVSGSKEGQISLFLSVFRSQKGKNILTTPLLKLYIYGSDS